MIMKPESLRQRQSRYQRDPDRCKNIHLSGRDADILTALVRERILSTSQIAALFFGQKSGAIRRLNQLWNAGYIDRDFAPVSFGMSEAIYSPSRKGVQFLIDERGISWAELGWNPKGYKITNWKKQHELIVNDLKVALVRALAERYMLYLPQREVKYVPKKGTGIKKRVDMARVEKILVFDKGSKYYDRVRDPKPNPGDRRDYIPIRPDRFMALNLPEGPVYGMWEIDRGTMPEHEFGRKLLGYQQYYRSGGFLKKYGQQGRTKEDYPFRVFTVTPDAMRRNSLVQQARDIGSDRLCWFAVLGEFLADPLGKVWIRGQEYGDLVKVLPKKMRSALEGRETGRPGELVRKAWEEINKQIARHSLIE